MNKVTLMHSNDKGRNLVSFTMRLLKVCCYLLSCLGLYLCSAQAQSLQAQSLIDATRKCAAEAFNGAFLIEPVSIPDNIRKKFNFVKSKTLQGFRIDAQCSGRYKTTSISIKSNAPQNNRLLVTDSDFNKLFVYQTNNRTKSITLDVCNKAIYFIPGIVISSKLHPFDNLEKDFASEVLSGKCIFNNIGRSVHQRSKVTVDIVINRILTLGF